MHKCPQHLLTTSLLRQKEVICVTIQVSSVSPFILYITVADKDMIIPLGQSDIALILNAHNTLRRNVDPPASNMQLLVSNIY